ncbi:MAG: DUF1080 domain-containing protein [Acidobacteria bacterium]|nr:DUF1080 domain-containing protein [Acidobacteriota bacterium]
MPPLLGLLPEAGGHIDFEPAESGVLPVGWLEVNSDRTVGNNWAVLAHLEATSGTKIFAKTAVLANPRPLPKAIWLGRSFRDGEVKIQIKPMGGLGSQDAGLVFRYLNEHNHYRVDANLLTGEVFVQRLQAGRMFPVVGKYRGTFRPNPAGWTLCRVVFDGPRIVVFVNDRRCVEAVDSTEGWAGKAGLWAASGSFTFFDDFEVAAQN